MIRILSSILFTLAMLAAGDAPPTPLPADAQAALTKAEKAEATVQAKANAEVVKIRKELIAALTKAQEAATKKGDLNTALAVKAKLDAVTLPEDALMPGAAPAAPAALTKEKVAGRYSITTEGGWSGVFSLRPNGECVVPGNHGLWKVQGRKVTCNWDNRVTDWFTLTTDTEGEGKDKTDGWLKARKLEE